MIAHTVQPHDIDPEDGFRCIECGREFHVGDEAFENLLGWAEPDHYHPDVDTSNGAPIVEYLCGLCAAAVETEYGLDEIAEMDRHTIERPPTGDEGGA